jgi:Domain of unknown function (DUF4166)
MHALAATLGKDRSRPLPDFERLLGAQAWARLPAAVRARFAIDAHAATNATYEGTASVRATFSGRLFAHACRLVGTPIAPYVGEHVRMRVHVYANDAGIVWERHYDFGARQCVVRSTKEFDGATLVENLGMGLNMRLNVFEANGALHFLSTRYFFRLGRLRIELPDWFLPGATHVVHEDLGAGKFRFTLATDHAWFGAMFVQDGVFS